jgi:hypothetical protein
VLFSSLTTPSVSAHYTDCAFSAGRSLAVALLFLLRGVLTTTPLLSSSLYLLSHCQPAPPQPSLIRTTHLPHSSPLTSGFHASESGDAILPFHAALWYLPHHSYVFNRYAQLPPSSPALRFPIAIQGVSVFCNIILSASVKPISTHSLATNNATNRALNKSQATAAPPPRFMIFVVIFLGRCSKLRILGCEFFSMWCSCCGFLAVVQLFLSRRGFSHCHLLIPVTAVSHYHMLIPLLQPGRLRPLELI